MIQVRQLTETQKDQLIGQTFDGIQFFNPVLDANGSWFISNEEYNYLTLVRANELGVISWWFTLPEIDYNPVVFERPL
jgi:hypothetical protein